MDLAETKRWESACKNPASDASHWTATPIKDALSWLIAEVERLQEIVGRYEKVMSEDLHIEKLVYENGSLDLNATHPLAKAVTAALVSVFVSGGAENYFEMNVYHPTTGPLSVVLQRTTGKTPAQIAGELRTKVAELQSSLTLSREEGRREGMMEGLNIAQEIVSKAMLDCCTDWTLDDMWMKLEAAQAAIRSEAKGERK